MPGHACELCSVRAHVMWYTALHETAGMNVFGQDRENEYTPHCPDLHSVLITFDLEGKTT